MLDTQVWAPNKLRIVYMNAITRRVLLKVHFGGNQNSQALNNTDMWDIGAC